VHFADDEAEEEQRNKMGGTSSKGNESLSKDLPGDEGEDEPLSFFLPNRVSTYCTLAAPCIGLASGNRRDWELLYFSRVMKC